MGAFNEACVRRLLAAVESSWLKIPVLLGISMGMRRGECLALTWDDVDLTTGALRIDKSLIHLQSQEPSVKRPKRERSRRATMPETLIAALRHQSAQQDAHRSQLGDGWQDNRLVCPDEFGKRRSPHQLTNHFGLVIDQLGLPDITFHDLRHVNATLLLLAGVPDKVVAARLGHSDTRITRDLYQHVLPPMDQEAAQKTDEFFRRVLGNDARG